jgi:hypothetical protein
MYNDVQDRLLNWWEHADQERPCMLIYANRNSESAAEQCTESLDDYWLDPARHERRAIEGITNKRYFGEALPFHYVDFGGLSFCGMQGCTIHYTDRGTIWMSVLYDTLIEAMSADVNDSLPFTRCVRESFERVASSVKGRSLVGPYSLCSPCDNLAGLIGMENFIYAMYDEPQLLEQAIRRQLDLWLKEFSYVCSVLKPSPALPTTGWHGILAPGSTFPIQEDMGYLLDRENYNRYCLPGIRTMVESQEYPFFHLDGPGALKHLDALLGISSLKAIQWQPGEGHTRVDQWYDVIKKIIDGGKSCQLYVQPEEIEPLIEEVGAKGLLLIITTDEERAQSLAEHYRLEENMPS